MHGISGVLMVRLLVARISIVAGRMLGRLIGDVEQFGQPPVVLLQQLQGPQSFDARCAPGSSRKLPGCQCVLVDGDGGVGRVPCRCDRSGTSMVVGFYEGDGSMMQQRQDAADCRRK
uniref:Secreted protein n=1 Tax=Bionectria ochroleuca TaxID=29856 RepID=A0A8H7NP23_BIOOC